MPDGIAAGLVLTVVVALAFDFTNGFHDTANAIATSVSTRAVQPLPAVLLSAVLNLAGAIVAIEVLHSTVSNTVGSLVKPVHGSIALAGIVAALIAAIAWNLVTWRAGLPSSSSHALIGALIGMGLGVYGTSAIVWTKVVPVVSGLVVSPITGFVLAYIFSVGALHAFRGWRPGRANLRLRQLQVLSGSLVSFSHGANDAQKTMAVMTLALVSAGRLNDAHGFPSPPLWVVCASAAAIAAGTFVGGWRIIRTLGSRVAQLEPVDGFSAQSMSAIVILTATQLALPVSTTHVVSGAVMGTGTTRRLSAVRWGTARDMVVAWIITIPISAVLGAALSALSTRLF